MFILLDNGKEENRQSAFVGRSPVKSKQASTEPATEPEELSAFELGKLRESAQKRGHGLHARGRGGELDSSGVSVFEEDDLRYDVSLDFDKCDWVGAINFQPRRYGTFGYLLSWSGCN